MAVSIRKLVALLMLVVLTANVCVWDSSAARVAHQIAHLGVVDQSADSHSHPGLATNGELGKTGVLHHVLHALDHAQHAADLAYRPALFLPPAGGNIAIGNDLPAAQAALAPPYRPPSGAASLA